MSSQPAFAALPAAPVETIEGDLARGVLVLCDHASNAMPAEFGDLGLAQTELRRHIAYDIGAAAVTRALARALSATALLTTFSRLLIDPNRGPDDPTLVMRLADGAIVPGNARIDPAGVAARVERFYRPYDEAITAALDGFAAAGIAPAVISIHSFTPAMKGRARPWHVGILWDADPRLNEALIAALRAEPGLVVGDNQPYDGALIGDTLNRHATARGLANTLIEIRQDLIEDDAAARGWGERLARLLGPLLDDPALRRIEHHPTRVSIRHRTRRPA